MKRMGKTLNLTLKELSLVGKTNWNRGDGSKSGKADQSNMRWSPKEREASQSNLD